MNWRRDVFEKAKKVYVAHLEVHQYEVWRRSIGFKSMVPILCRYPISSMCLQDITRIYAHIPHDTKRLGSSYS